jgi:tetratricopeptide (TPR) repeat protein
LALCLVCPPATAAAADAALAQANSALAGGQYAVAEALAASGLAEAGQDQLTKARLLVVRGLALQAQGRGNDSLVDFTLALQGDSLAGEERGRVLFARGLSLDGLGRLQEAIGDYTAALRFVPRATFALNNRANVYRRQGRFQEARRDYTAALAADTPNPQYPFFGLGQIAEAQGDESTAREFYDKAVLADPGFQLAWERLQAMGPFAGETALMPADPGVIVLRPPHALKRQSPGTQPSSGARAAFPRPGQAVTQIAAPSASAAPGWGMPLRPTIVDSAAIKGALAQLGAWRSEAEARQGWALAQEAAGDVLTGLSPQIVRAELPERGVYYRLRVAAPSSVARFCAMLWEKRLACIPVRD